MSGEATVIVNSIAIILFAGILASRFAQRIGFPKKVPLIIIGMLYAVIESPRFVSFEDEGIKDIALVLAELALIMVLYTEGMHLDLNSLVKHLLPILLLAIIGTITTVFLSAFILTSIVSPFSTEISISLLSLNVLLIAAIVVPTDPAATFSILKNSGGTVKPRIETILGGESAFNDITAILLVVILFIPQVLLGNTSLDVNEAEVIRSVTIQVFGGILLGTIIALLIHFMYRRVKAPSEYSYISASGVFAIFIFAPYLEVSAAIAALIAGILIKNPKYIFIEGKYDKTQLFTFWEDLTYVIEIFAFVSVGILFDFDHFRKYFWVGVALSLILILSRIISIYITTLPLNLTSVTNKHLEPKERMFIAIAGFKGLTTVVLALIAYINLVSINEILANTILYSSLSAILISGIFQGILLPYVTKKTGVSEDASSQNKAQIYE